MRPASPGWRGAVWGLAVLSECALEALASAHPDCRKSPELHFQRFPSGDERLVAFGGKGFAWEKRGEHKRRVEVAEAFADQDEEAGEEADARSPSAEGGERAGRRLKGKKWRRRVRMFGDTWAFDLESRSWEEVKLPPAVQGAEGNHPAPRWKPSSTVIQNDTGIALFGGCRTTSVAGVMDDLWVFRAQSCCPAGGDWQRIRTAKTPRARRGHVAVGFLHSLVVFGGKGYNADGGPRSECLRDVWSLDAAGLREGADAVWERGQEFPGECRWGATGSSLRGPDGREYLAIFGGRNRNSGEALKLHGKYTYYNELWLYDLAAKKWSLQLPEGPKPQPRDHHGAATVGGDLFVFGGRVKPAKTADAIVGDVWSYSLSLGQWRKHPSASGASPGARYMPGVTTVDWRGGSALAVFAGETLPGSTKETTLNDVWVFEPSSGQWTLLFDVDCSRAQGPAGGHRSPAASVAETLVCLLAGLVCVALGWMVLQKKCRQAVARSYLSVDVDDAARYRCLG